MRFWRTARLHTSAMEVKEHVPWIASMLASAVAFVAVRYRPRLLADPSLRRIAMTLLTAGFALASLVSLLGVLVDRIAPPE